MVIWLIGTDTIEFQNLNLFDSLSYELVIANTNRFLVWGARKCGRVAAFPNTIPVFNFFYR